MWSGGALRWLCVLGLAVGKGLGEDAPAAVAPASELHHVAVSATDAKPETNATEANVTTSTTAPATTKAPVLPPKGSQEKEHKSSMAIFFILAVIVVSILLVHVLLVTEVHVIPESLAIVVLGLVIGLGLKLSGKDWSEEEAFSPSAFFLVLLPPIIFEGGYNLHKGNFFANIGSILVFAILGTLISALVVGGGVFLLGQADLIYALSGVEAMAFGSMISAVDPVATLAIFQALKVDPILYMLVFGESMLNDAVAIVLTNTFLELRTAQELSFLEGLLSSLSRFSAMLFGSMALGLASGAVSALLLKHVRLRRTPSLEFGLMLVFAYLPYGLAEGLHLSGIMAILFCGIGMSHYTHWNLSPMTQITMTQTFRTLAFVSETCVFAYLGLAFFTFPLLFRPVFVVWSIVLCLLGRAANIFPLSYLMNRVRQHQITRKMQCIMWFSGLRGAIAFALSMHMEFEKPETRRMMITSTLTIVLFTIIVLGGGTLPMMKLLNRLPATADAEVGGGRREARRRSRRKRRGRSSSAHSALPKRSSSAGFRGISKTADWGSAVELDHSAYSTDFGDGGTPSSASSSASRSPSTASPSAFLRHLRELERLDALYLRPFFVRKFSQQEKKESTLKLTDMALEWFQAVEAQTSEEDASLSQPASQPSTSSRAARATTQPSASSSANSNTLLHISSSSDGDDRSPLI